MPARRAPLFSHPSSIWLKFVEKQIRLNKPCNCVPCLPEYGSTTRIQYNTSVAFKSNKITYCNMILGPRFCTSEGWYSQRSSEALMRWILKPEVAKSQYEYLVSSGAGFSSEAFANVLPQSLCETFGKCFDTERRPGHHVPFTQLREGCSTASTNQERVPFPWRFLSFTYLRASFTTKG